MIPFLKNANKNAIIVFLTLLQKKTPTNPESKKKKPKKKPLQTQNWKQRENSIKN